MQQFRNGRRRINLSFKHLYICAKKNDVVRQEGNASIQKLIIWTNCAAPRRRNNQFLDCAVSCLIKILISLSVSNQNIDWTVGLLIKILIVFIGHLVVTITFQVVSDEKYSGSLWNTFCQWSWLCSFEWRRNITMTMYFLTVNMWSKTLMSRKQSKNWLSFLIRT